MVSMMKNKTDTVFECVECQETLEVVDSWAHRGHWAGYFDTFQDYQKFSERVREELKRTHQCGAVK